MHRAAQLLLGTHDFSAFCANKKMKKSTVRTIKAFSVERVGSEIHFTVTGNGFLHNMVRILVGTLIEVGRGEREMESIPELFGARREQAGFLAPGKGLCLMEVRY
jgi:tRNA pseudouridine38-40 synthase